MRQILIGWLLAIVVTAAHAAAPASAASASTASGAVPPLTPQQAKQALAVLENTQQRAQFEATLRAIAAVGELSTPVPASAASACRSRRRANHSIASAGSSALRINCRKCMKSARSAPWVSLLRHQLPTEPTSSRERSESRSALPICAAQCEPWRTSCEARPLVWSAAGAEAADAGGALAAEAALAAL
ncbi:hypothetical protein PPH41_08765, partial [Burkholderia gladioli]|nr:hypothetical protein [Burkholderia gladioli]